MMLRIVESSLSVTESDIPLSGRVTPSSSVKEDVVVSKEEVVAKEEVASLPTRGLSTSIKNETAVSVSSKGEVPVSSKEMKSSSSKESISSSPKEETNVSPMEEKRALSKEEKQAPSKETTSPSNEKQSTPVKEKRRSKSTPSPKRAKSVAPFRVCGSMLSEADRDVLVSLVTSFPNSVLLRRTSREVGDVVVAGRSARSVKVLCAVARGVSVVRKEWLYASLEKGEWARVEDFIDAIAEEGLERRRSQKWGVFKECGLIYVDKYTTPNRDDLEAIIEGGDGKVTRDMSKAAICVIHAGDKKLNGTCVTEKFVIEGAIHCQLPPVSEDEADTKEGLVEAESEEYSSVCLR